MIDPKTRSPLLALYGILVAAMIGRVLIHSGCGPSAREKTISTTFTTVNALRKGFETWNLERQTQLAVGSATADAAEAAVAAHRVRIAPVYQAFELAYRVIAAATITEATPLVDIVDALAKLKEALSAVQSSSSGSGSASPEAPINP